MMKTKFDILNSTCVPLPYENVDTDQIIPARFLSSTSREGFGENLFRDWRYDKSGKKNPEFSLNDPAYSGKILVAGKNFGCGSSREHAVWAVYDYGFRAVISSFFADIFRNNALNNGLLPVVIPEKLLAELLDLIKKNPGTIVIIDLQQQLVTIPSMGESSRFEINPYKKECLLKGLDDIEYLLGMQGLIRDYEVKTRADENRNN
jgi:3-isopropylmalate/(R)-2-methylmalate dehydratase small subunit